MSSTLEPLFGDLMYNNPNEDEVCVSDLYDSVEEMDLDDLFEEISTRLECQFEVDMRKVS